jgi:transcriptional regulator with XRE-family HTH domain
MTSPSPFSDSGIIRFVRHQRELRGWNLTHLAKQANLTQAEVSRLESGVRKPTMRVCLGLAEAFADSDKPEYGMDNLERFEDWVTMLVILGQRARTASRRMREAAQADA